ncbi:hypothetical protein L226DRAFT_216635 [Lentinus tigrinus ALCF2SS1-7]|uniref:uncharacterized protein n=1 Tax=Lentinus tigrinus ALCF2SS1-7 TaxID=1328758 RepID=UPI001166301B|nr:hypothetical protein L226DRAFT_216635 [Lentinus tigrinus ALCF2SS1-7]
MRSQQAGIFWRIIAHSELSLGLQVWRTFRNRAHTHGEQCRCACARTSRLVEPKAEARVWPSGEFSRVMLLVSRLGCVQARFRGTLFRGGSWHPQKRPQQRTYGAEQNGRHGRASGAPGGGTRRRSSSQPSSPLRTDDTYGCIDAGRRDGRFYADLGLREGRAPARSNCPIPARSSRLRLVRHACFAIHVVRATCACAAAHERSRFRSQAEQLTEMRGFLARAYSTPSLCKSVQRPRCLRTGDARDHPLL